MTADRPRKAIARALLLGGLVHAGGVIRAAEIPQATPDQVGLSAEKLDQAYAKVQESVDNHQTAGVVLLVARKGKLVGSKAFGKTTPARENTAGAARPARSFGWPRRRS